MIRAPFGRTGGKSKNFQKIIDIFPDKPKYVEVFGGSGVILLNKKPVGNEVFNDIEKGLVSFYRCIQDPDRLAKLSAKLDQTIHSRDFWNWCKDGMNYGDDIDRAFKWYYVTRFSFGQQGRAFGRSTGTYNADSGKVRNSIPGFATLHNRLRRVLIECKGFRQIIKDFDSKDCLFYLDPPYLDTFRQAYKHGMGLEDHEDLLRLIGTCKGTVVISGYPNELYDKQTYWTNKHTWTQEVLARGTYQGNDYSVAEEVVWIKE